MAMRCGWKRGALATLACAVVGSSLAHVQAQTTWEQVVHDTSPEARWGAGVAYDTLRDRVVMFGGQGAIDPRLSDTWEWNGADWVRQTPAHVPAGRRRPSMAFDSRRGVCVLFGGYTGTVTLGDTWEWDGADWTLRTPTTSPPSRADGAMTFDSARGVCVLYGGNSGTTLGDHWEYDGITWTQRAPALNPGLRQNSAIAFDDDRDVCVLFGGYRGVALGDTWEWNGSAWTQRTVAVQPSPRSSSAAAYDVARRCIVLHGGHSGTAVLGDTWEWSGTAWVERAPATPLAPRYQHAACWIESARCVLTVGGIAPFVTWIYRPDPRPDFETYGAGCAGTDGVPRLFTNDDGPFVDDVFTVKVDTLPRATPPLVAGLLGFGDVHWVGVPLPYDAAPIGAPGCLVYNDVAIAPWLPVVAGVATWDTVFPATPPLQGLPFFQQAVVLDPGANPLGIVVSNPARAHVGGR